MKEEDLTHGKILFIKGNSEYIVRHDKADVGGPYCTILSLTLKFLYKPGCWGGLETYLANAREATEEEVYWFEICEKVGQYIEKPVYITHSIFN